MLKNTNMRQIIITLAFLFAFTLTARSQGAAVDLGLSVKWASCNVGAKEPYESGNYYAWGEVKPKECYDESTYKWGTSKNGGIKKYNVRESNHTIHLEAADDAARQNLGGGWRMPTYQERNELETKCRWSWTKKKGVYGYEITSKANGNSIFLPATGYMFGVNMISVPYGYYWTATLSDSESEAYSIAFDQDVIYPYEKAKRYDGRNGTHSRSFGFCIRPVKP